MIVTTLIVFQDNEFEPDGIIQSLLVYHIFNCVRHTCFAAFGQTAVFFRYHVDGIPTFGHSFFPQSNVLGQPVIIGRELGKTFRFLNIELVVIVVELSLHRVMGRDGGDGVLDNFDPTLAVTFLILTVIERDDVVFEQSINGSRIKLVLIAWIRVCSLLRKCPTGIFAIAFYPPSIENREIDNTIHLSLLTRCSRCFERTRGGIHPNIDTRHKTACQLHIIIFKEDYLTEEFGPLTDLEYLLNKSLTSSICRMRLAREEEQYGTLGGVDEARKTFKIGKE